MAAARNQAKICLGHEVEQDNAHRMWYVQGKCVCAHVQHMGAFSRVGTGHVKNYQEYEDQAMVERLIMKNNAACFRLMETCLWCKNRSFQNWVIWQIHQQQNKSWMVLMFALLVQIILLGIFLHVWMFTLYGSSGSDIYGVYKGRLSGVLEKSKERTSSSLLAYTSVITRLPCTTLL
jgi:hypothetical protein